MSIDECILLRSSHLIKIYNIFITLKSSLGPSCSPFPQSPEPQVTWSDICFYGLDFLFNKVSCNWNHTISILLHQLSFAQPVYLKFSHDVPCISHLLLFITDYCSILRIYVVSCVDGHVGCFQLFGTNALVNADVQVFTWTYILFLLNKQFGVKLVHLVICLRLSLFTVANLFF